MKYAANIRHTVSLMCQTSGDEKPALPVTSAHLIGFTQTPISEEVSADG